MTKVLTIHKRRIGLSDEVYMMAEVGSNHGGSFRRAQRMIEAAKQCGCDAVKFQSLQADRMVARTENQLTRINDEFQKYGRYLHEIYKRSETPGSWLKELRRYAKSQKIDFVCTPFDEESVDLLAGIDIDAFKVASFEINHIPLLNKIGKTKKPVILSTGMATLSEVKQAIEILESQGSRQIAILHCNIGYPPRAEQINLRAIPLLLRTFAHPVGYSDHTLGIHTAVAAIAMGARILEKHMRLDCVATPDYFFSMNQQGLAQLVRAVRETSISLGKPWKGVSSQEQAYHRRSRRGLFARRDIYRGERIQPQDVAVLRPCAGISAGDYRKIIRKRAKKNISEGTPISWACIDI